jgi:hypothetical protein
MAGLLEAVASAGTSSFSTAWEAGADLDLSLPLDEGDQQRKRKDHYKHRKRVADR